MKACNALRNVRCHLTILYKNIIKYLKFDKVKKLFPIAYSVQFDINVDFCSVND